MGLLIVMRHSTLKRCQKVVCCPLFLALLVMHLAVARASWTDNRQSQQQGNQSFKCFETGAELATAVQAWPEYQDSASSISQTYGYSIGQWCVDKVQSFSLVFARVADFNEPLDGWNTSAATSMEEMFYRA
jgi:hypothetical protein